MFLVMINLLKNYYAALESLRGRQLFVTLLTVFILFVLLGFFIGYLNSERLNKSEKPSPNNKVVLTPPDPKTTYSGVVTFIGSNVYPEDGIMYSLVDTSGKQLTLLKSDDDKLAISEGLFITVSGRIEKTVSGRDSYLFVEEVTISRGSN